MVGFWQGCEAVEVLPGSVGQPNHLCLTQTQLPAQAPALGTFQLDISETQGSANQKSSVKTVLNKRLTCAQRNT